MKSIKTNVIVSLFILFLALCVIGTSAVIYTTPVEITSGTAGNFTVNIANGGKVLEDEGFLFFIKPSSSGIIRTETDNSATAVDITSVGDGYLQCMGNVYYFTQNDALMRCDWEGDGLETVVDYAKKPLVVGATVFYIDRSGSLMKYSMQTEKTITVLENPENGINEFAVYYRKIYYTDNTGSIYKVSFDGSDNKLFLKTNAKALSVDGQYLFYIANGTVCSAAMSESDLVSVEIVKADEYAVYGEYILYSIGENLYHTDINEVIKSGDKAKITKVADEKCTAISIDDDYFYYFNASNELMRIPHGDPTKTEKIK